MKRMGLKNKQKMWYAIPNGSTPVYVRDESGNIVYESYTDSDGNVIYILDDNNQKIPMMTGEGQQSYTQPVQFLGGISGRITQALIEAYGIDDTTMYAQIDYNANEYPFTVGTLIWKRNQPTITSGTVVKESADYEVVGVLDEYPNIWTCLLKRVLK